jgi:hypothetical protein
MKLRMKGNSLRFRLQRSDVAKLFESSDVSEVLNVGPTDQDTFCYRLRVHAGDTAELRFAASELLVCVPATWAKELATTEKVGFVAEVNTSPESSVHLTVEKDFQCLIERPEDKNSDPYPNPEASACGVVS